MTDTETTTTTGKSGDERTKTLPSGAVATIRAAKGRDLIQAARMAGSNDGIRLTFGIIAVLTRINGRPIVVEDIEEMNLMDVMTLMGEVQGNGVSLPSSTSSNSGSTGGSDTLN